MVITFVAALPGTYSLCFPCFTDRALGLPEQVCSVHLHCYTSLSGMERMVGTILGLINIIVQSRRCGCLPCSTSHAHRSLQDMRGNKFGAEQRLHCFQRAVLNNCDPGRLSVCLCCRYVCMYSKGCNQCLSRSRPCGVQCSRNASMRIWLNGVPASVIGCVQRVTVTKGKCNQGLPKE